jgi:hypothetical protein
MQISKDGTIGARRIEDAPTSHPWRWLSTVICGAIICFVAVAAARSLFGG